MLHAGLDWSGTPHLKESTPYVDLFVPCIAGVTDAHQLEEEFSQVKKDLGWPRDKEIHAHECPERELEAIVIAILPLEVRIGALLIDKGAVQPGEPRLQLPPPASFPAEAAIALLERFLPLYALGGLWCDEDIGDRERQKAFNTAVQRLHRRHWPDASLKVRHKTSKSSGLIQLADVMAYGLTRLARGSFKTPSLRQYFETIRDNPANRVIGPIRWEK